LPGIPWAGGVADWFDRADARHPCLSAVRIELCLLPLARHFEAAAANELHNVLQFVAVEPRAVAAAGIHDHAGAPGEIDAVHEGVALRAMEITHFVQGEFHARGWRRCPAEHDGLL